MTLSNSANTANSSSTAAAKSRRVLILGAGVVGVSAARCLQAQGFEPVLIDRREPASETSGGSAGIITSSPVPLNTPALWQQLPSLLFSSSAALCLDWRYAISRLPWLVQFILHARKDSALRRAHALNHLVVRSGELHQQWITECGELARLRKTGWLKCYRSERSFASAAPERALLEQTQTQFRVLDANELSEFAPALNPVFARAVHFQDAMSVINPRQLVRMYARQFTDNGGRFIQAEVATLSAAPDGWRAKFVNGEEETAPMAVVALGPWSRDFLRKLGIVIPMGFERGGHRHFAVPSGLLPTPIADLDAGYAAVMQSDSVRMTTGVQLAAQNAPRSTVQLDATEKYLRNTIKNIGEKVGDDWYGARPTMPDCLPLIGPLKPFGLWAATAHQHIGLTTAPATGEILAAWMNGTPPDHASLFHPKRFGL